MSFSRVWGWAVSQAESAYDVSWSEQRRDGGTGMGGYPFLQRSQHRGAGRSGAKAAGDGGAPEDIGFHTRGSFSCLAAQPRQPEGAPEFDNQCGYAIVSAILTAPSQGVNAIGSFGFLELVNIDARPSI